MPANTVQATSCQRIEAVKESNAANAAIFIPVNIRICDLEDTHQEASRSRASAPNANQMYGAICEKISGSLSRSPGCQGSGT
ncbi:hypothetical protein D3C75_1009340 [compost metagenome]